MTKPKLISIWLWVPFFFLATSHLIAEKHNSAWDQRACLHLFYLISSRENPAISYLVEKKIPVDMLATLLGSTKRGGRLKPELIQRYAKALQDNISKSISARFAALGGVGVPQSEEITFQVKDHGWVWIDLEVGGHHDAISLPLNSFFLNEGLADIGFFSRPIPNNSHAFQKSVAQILGETNFDTSLLPALLAGFGWKETTESPTFLKLPGLTLTAANPKDTEVIYRGLRVDRSKAAEIFQRGEVRALPTDKVEIERFLKMDLKGREKWVRKELVDRIAGMYNGVSLLMGGTLDSTVARTFGSYVFEIHVPKECRIPVRPAGDGEMEVFIPFGIAPEWIKKVVDSRTGNVIFERP